MFKRIFLVLAVLLFSTVVSAEWTDPWVHKNVTSQRDLLYIDMPDVIHRMEPVTITVYVNDPLIQEEANAVEPSPDNSNFFSIGRKVEHDSSGDLRDFIPYSGESSLTVGFVTNDFWTNEVKGASTPDVYFTFYKVKKWEGTGYPDTSNQSSEYYNWECTNYYTPYFCSDVKKGCMVCSKSLGTVWRQYELLPAKAVGTPPSGYTWSDGRGKDESLLTNPAYLSYSSTVADKPVGINDWTGRPVTCDESYSVGISVVSSLDRDFADLQKMNEGYNKAGIASGKTTVKLTSGPGGLFSGSAVEIITTDSNTKTESREYDWYNVGYTSYADFTPKGSGMGTITMYRQGCTLKGGGKAAIEKAIAGIKQFASGYSTQNEGAKTGKVLGHYYDVLTRATPSAIVGRITDGHNLPLPYMTVSVDYDGTGYTGATDENGNYVVNIPNLLIDSSNPKIATLKLYLTYNRDNKNYFTVKDHMRGDKLVTVEKNFSLETDMDKTQDFDFGTTSFTDTTSTSILANLKHIGPMYAHLSEVTDFALTQYKADIDYKLPVDVFFASNQGTAYSRDTSTIQILADDSAYSSSDRPDNREYHEFSHHILFSQWNGSGLRGPGDANHDGYINNGTGDSYTEGFAEFSAMAVSKYKGDPKPDIYAGFGSLELNYKSWEHRGYDEELAVAGILWDLYDDKNDANDTISLPLEQMWNVMKVKRANFYEYYKAFKAAFPDKADAIDKIFIDHGFYSDKNAGNGVRDLFEPYRDANGNNRYDAGETFVDYGGQVDGENMSYDVGETIGKATNYNRLDRGSVVKLPGSFIKASDANVKTYKVKVHLNNPSDGQDFEYIVTAENGLVYVAPIPESIDADIIVTPDTKEYASDKPYTTTNKEVVQKFNSAPDSQGYFDSHNFEVKSTGVKEDNGISITGQSSSTQQTNNDGSVVDVSVPLWAIGGGILLIGGGIFFVILVVIVLLVLRKKKK